MVSIVAWNKISPGGQSPRGDYVWSLAENGGFEPPRAFTQHAFQACAIGH